jgi:transposase
VVGITWPVPDELGDIALERRLFSPPFAVHEGPRPQPDWARLCAELRRPGVTLLLLWEEYRTGQPDGYGYSRFCDLSGFCDLYRDWRASISPTMRQSVALRPDRAQSQFAHQSSDTPASNRNPFPQQRHLQPPAAIPDAR